MLQRFFIICSGADKDLIAKCSNGEQNKYAGIGATVFFTALMATIAASYALYTIFDNYYAAILFGLVWGLLIFNLDRFIVATIKKRERFLDELLQATPRIILAIIIAVVISKPLELKIFEKEINQVLLTEKNQMTLENKDQIALQYQPEKEILITEITALKKEISAKEAAVNALYNTYIAEAEGREGTKLIGKGPVYKEKRAKHDAGLEALQALKEKNTTKIEAKEAEILALNTEYNKQLSDTQPIIDGYDGLMARINALGKLPWVASFFIFLLFLAIETSPIIAKLLSPKGEYDYKLEDVETASKTWVNQNINQREIIFQTDQDLNHKIYADIAEEDELYDYKRKKARELMQVQADTFFEKQKRSLF